MIRTLVRKIVTIAIAGAAVLGAAGSAQAKAYVGTWDPAFGTPFAGLGWSGTTTFTIDDSCAASGNVFFFQCAMSIQSASVNLYNLASPSTVLGTLTFAPPPQIPLSMFIAAPGADVTGINTNGLLGPVLSSGVSFLTLGNNYFFDLQFAYNATTGQEEVVLYYTLYDQVNGTIIDPRSCAALGNSAFCGVSSNPGGNAVVMTITPVPEPATYALMLAGLGVVGFAARRRRRQ